MAKSAALGFDNVDQDDGGYDWTISSGAENSPSTQAAPVSAATPTASSILAQLSNAGIEADVAKLMVNNSLSYSSMLTILQDAAVGGMTASKFSTLETLASLLNAADGISTTAYVQQITDDVIDGNGANATWNGGSSTPVKLGNLSAKSSATQVDELIGEWFLGTDLPGTNVSSVGETNYNPTYKLSTSPLYGASGAPTYLDVNQGYIGDCYFMAAIAEVALQDPAAIEVDVHQQRQRNLWREIHHRWAGRLRHRQRRFAQLAAWDIALRTARRSNSPTAPSSGRSCWKRPTPS